MKAHERFFQKEIQHIARVKEQAIDHAYEGKQGEIIKRFFEEIKTGKAVLLPEVLEYEQWSGTPPIGDCFSFADGSRLGPLLDSLQDERKAALRRLRDEVTRINCSIMLDDLDKPTLARMLAEFEALVFVSHSLPAGKLPRLISLGESVINAIKAVRQHTGWGLKESKEFVDSAPVDFPVMDNETTLKLVHDLQETGAVVAFPKETEK